MPLVLVDLAWIHAPELTSPCQTKIIQSASQLLLTLLWLTGGSATKFGVIKLY